jgi:hypothetical protein
MDAQEHEGQARAEPGQVEGASLPVPAGDRDPETGRFLVGNRANVGGRANRAGLQEALHNLMASPAKGYKRKTNARLLAEKLLKEALRGNVKAAAYIYDRLEGSPIQTQFQGQLESIPFVFGWNPPHQEETDGDGT